jgi:hypothetical protein
MPAPPDPLADALRDRYTLQRDLGPRRDGVRGSGHDLRHDRPVALKIFHPDVAADPGPERFLREIQLTARLQRPHILPIHDSGEQPVYADSARIAVEQQLTDVPDEAYLNVYRGIALAILGRKAEAIAAGKVPRCARDEVRDMWPLLAPRLGGR